MLVTITDKKSEQNKTKKIKKDIFKVLSAL